MFTKHLLLCICRCITFRSILILLYFQRVTSFASRSRLVSSEIQNLPYVGLSKKSGVNFVVVGTSHFQCNSGTEITSLIQELNPDGVVVELDPERVIRLTKEAATSGSSPWFGADFLAAIETAREMDIPLFLGDEYTKETRSRFLNTLLTPTSYDPRSLISSMFRSSAQIDLLQTFTDDPMKLAPLVVTLSIPLMAFVVEVFCQGHGAHFDVTSLRSSYVSISLVGSFFGICKVYNTLISERDDVLVYCAIHAATVIRNLHSKQTIRKRWTFPISSNSNISQHEKLVDIPLFTLKRPLQEDAIRSLNLFEPRWLAMIDHIQSACGAVPPQFGCLTCVNKFYCSISLDGKEGRYADVIFNRQGRMASLVSVTEGNRPSGDRKVTVVVEGKGAFTLDENSISVNDSGYLKTSTICGQSSPSMATNHQSDDDLVIVVVVGLLHANGVIEQLISRS